jgi:hypothetical protein
MTRLPNPWTTPLVSVVVAGQLLGMSARTAYRAAARGDIPTTPLGVPVADLYRLLHLPIPPPPPAPPRVIG